MASQPTSVRNGVDVNQLMTAIEAVKKDPKSGELKFVVRSTWKGGLKAEHQPLTYTVGPQKGQHSSTFTLRTDEPREILGTDTGMSPAEVILGALGACLAVGYAANAAAQGIDLDQVTVELTGNGNLEGFMNLNNKRAGLSNISIKTHLKSRNSSPKQLKDLHDYVNEHSPIWDTIANPVKITSELSV